MAGAGLEGSLCLAEQLGWDQPAACMVAAASDLWGLQHIRLGEGMYLRPAQFQQRLGVPCCPTAPKKAFWHVLGALGHLSVGSR